MKHLASVFIALLAMNCVAKEVLTAELDCQQLLTEGKVIIELPDKPEPAVVVVCIEPKAKPQAAPINSMNRGFKA
jgi:hypothetical protein